MADYKFDYKKTYINPYNFVPMPKMRRGNNNDESSENDQFTGVLHCRLILKTPLIIPDTLKRSEDETIQEHYRYPFMQLDGRDAIPASSIRGPIRSVYETMTNSCYTTTRENQILENRAKKAFKPGLLRKINGQWKLYKAERYCVDKKVVETWKYGQKINFKENKEKSKGFQKFAKDVTCTNKNNCDGYLFRGEYIATKEYESIFKLINNKEVLVDLVDNKRKLKPEELNAAVNRLMNILAYYHNSEQSCGGGDNPELYKNYKHIEASLFGDENACIPVWYEFEDKTLHLSFASIGRFEYENTLNKVLGTFDACKKREKCCPACNLFGMAAKDEAAAGKVRFTDAGLDKGGKKKYIDLRELGTPHITYLPFYTENAMGYDENGVRIRGRKFYWHHYPDMKLAKAEENTNLNSTMEYLEKGEFIFDVFYDRVTQQQLKELMWVLCMGDNDRNGSMCHKIGHAKPLGFGSVKIIIESRKERVYSPNNGYQLSDGSIDKNFFEHAFDGFSNQKTIKAMTAMADFSTIPKNYQVCYPYVEEEHNPNKILDDNVLASHQWYSYNYPFGSKRAKINLANADMGAKKLQLPHLVIDKLKQNDYATFKGEISFIKKGSKKFGFIKPEDGEENIYFNGDKTTGFDKMKKGNHVSYQLAKSQDERIYAVNVKIC